MPKEWKRKILIDTDLGDDVDDAAALIMALNSPELDIVGITTVFKDTVKRAEMVLELCEQYGRSDIPVCAGFGNPLIERPDCEEAPVQYEILKKGQEQNIYRQLDGADFIIQTVKEHPDLTIVEMGPMTNLGIAFYRNPELMKNVPVIAMGGVFSSSAPEWNMKCDPEAARIVMDYAEHLTMFGLEVTKYCKISDQDLETLCPPENDRMQYYRKGTRIFREKMGYVFTLHDVLLMVYLLDSSVVEVGKSDYTVELAGEQTRGAIVFKTNAYDIHTEVEKDFYYTESLDIEKFNKIVKERIY